MTEEGEINYALAQVLLILSHCIFSNKHVRQHRFSKMVLEGQDKNVGRAETNKSLQDEVVQSNILNYAGTRGIYLTTKGNASGARACTLTKN